MEGEKETEPFKDNMETETSQAKKETEFTGRSRVEYDIYKDNELDQCEGAVVGVAGGEHPTVPLRIEKTKCKGCNKFFIGRASQVTADQLLLGHTFSN